MSTSGDLTVAELFQDILEKALYQALDDQGLSEFVEKKKIKKTKLVKSILAQKANIAKGRATKTSSIPPDELRSIRDKEQDKFDVKKAGTCIHYLTAKGDKEGNKKYGFCGKKCDKHFCADHAKLKTNQDIAAKLKKGDLTRKDYYKNKCKARDNTIDKLLKDLGESAEGKVKFQGKGGKKGDNDNKAIFSTVAYKANKELRLVSSKGYLVKEEGKTNNIKQTVVGKVEADDSDSDAEEKEVKLTVDDVKDIEKKVNVNIDPSCLNKEAKKYYDSRAAIRESLQKKGKQSDSSGSDDSDATSSDSSSSSSEDTKTKSGKSAPKQKGGKKQASSSSSTSSNTSSSEDEKSKKKPASKQTGKKPAEKKADSSSSSSDSEDEKSKKKDTKKDVKKDTKNKKPAEKDSSDSSSSEEEKSTKKPVETKKKKKGSDTSDSEDEKPPKKETKAADKKDTSSKRPAESKKKDASTSDSEDEKPSSKRSTEKETKESSKKKTDSASEDVKSKKDTEEVKSKKKAESTSDDEDEKPAKKSSESKKSKLTESESKKDNENESVAKSEDN